MVIWDWMVRETGLSGNELVVYAMVNGLAECSPDGTAYVPASYVVGWCNTSDRNARRIIDKLEKRGLIKCQGANEHGIPVYLPIRPSRETVPPDKMTAPCQNVSQYIYNPNSNVTDIDILPDKMSGAPCQNDRGGDDTGPAVGEIVAYLNEKAGTNYKATAANTIRHIRARMAEGFTVEDFKHVVDVKVADWKNDRNMRKYLRPETLFGSKFEGYLNQAAPFAGFSEPEDTRSIDEILDELDRRDGIVRPR